MPTLTPKGIQHKDLKGGKTNPEDFKDSHTAKKNKKYISKER